MAHISRGRQEEAAKTVIKLCVNVTHFTFSVNTNVKFPKKLVVGLSG